jgi:acetylornithine deacetylase/succinyl-diaminopimelate desuccinylase-like protein
MEELIPRLLDLAVAIQQIPAPSFHEAERAAFVRARFADENLQSVQMDSVGNVYACLGRAGRPATENRQPLILSAHLDTVFPLSVDLQVQREPERLLGPGLGDNSLGVAGLFGLLWTLHRRNLSLPGDLWLVADVCEEGLGNLRGMQAVVEHFQSERPKPPLAYIVLEGMALGQVYHRGLGVRRYRLSVRTAGGHSWVDYGRPSAIHELTELASRITGLELPRSPRTSLNVGVISGGTSINTIAAEAMLELDLRSEKPESLADLAAQVEALAASASKPGVTVELEAIGQRPAGELPQLHPLVRLAQDCLVKAGVEPRLNIGSTDANLPLSLGLPAVAIGLTTGAGAHTLHEYIKIAPLAKGVEQLVSLVCRAWD